ncbi:hypothetical protein OHA40_22385 [Nocardia sp. NBC_00508]|uniref:hypothetical protein n=1 Tax=Nocardia sp. NBC_00508 TaxID=2975992 RepID=UPI002E81D427|nr:hypothetical protein [Nocardia sp. NBC_00508]WUD64434.1 hypothetical protein OHA40_22385 [Nocardia sp. NBC_00508]
MANVDAVRLSNELGIDLAQAMLRLRREGIPGETKRQTCLRIIADEAHHRRPGARH